MLSLAYTPTAYNHRNFQSGIAAPEVIGARLTAKPAACGAIVKRANLSVK